MSRFWSELSELLNSIDEKQIEKLGYKSLSVINEAKQHQLWKPRMLIKTNKGEETIIDGEKEIIEKLKDIYNKTKKL